VIKRVEKSEEEWKKILTSEQFAVTRLKGTERPFTGEYCEMHQPGTYACVCCGTELFASDRKFDSGTGWPSFVEPLHAENVREEADGSLPGRPRVEVLCAACDGHLGHVFEDGPPPTGRRYCINSVSIRLVKKA
jgi:peptide-methionine (R)-S-oxide reductase